MHTRLIDSYRHKAKEMAARLITNHLAGVSYAAIGAMVGDTTYGHLRDTGRSIPRAGTVSAVIAIYWPVHFVLQVYRAALNVNKKGEQQ